jgi:RES domain-containing protein
LVIWRLCKARYAKELLNGEGARLYGGRWSYPGIAVGYTAGTLSLAVLEFLVHLDYEVAPSDMVRLQIEVPSSISIERMKVESLPKNWRAYPPPESLQKIGSSWAVEKRSLLLEVPSAVVPEEYNYLVNPQHPEFKGLKVERPQRFKFDSRLFKS